MAAGGAAVVAEMSHVGRRVHVRRAAADAPLGIGRVLELRRGMARVVDPEHGRLRPPAREVADLRVVAVHDERSVARKLRDRLTPARGQQLELAVAVELVAEQVPEADGARLQPPRHLGQRTLVDLEQPQLGVAGREKGGRDPGDEVRARAVVRQPHGRREDPRGHRRGRRLAVRGRDQALHPAEAARRGGRQLPDRASRAAFRARSSHRRRRPGERAGRPRGRAGSRRRGARERPSRKDATSSARRITRSRELSGLLTRPGDVGGVAVTDTFRQVFRPGG